MGVQDGALKLYLGIANILALWEWNKKAGKSIERGNRRISELPVSPLLVVTVVMVAVVTMDHREEVVLWNLDPLIRVMGKLSVRIGYKSVMSLLSSYATAPFFIWCSICCCCCYVFSFFKSCIILSMM